MSNPAQFCGTTGNSGSTKVLAVTSTTGSGSALVIVVGNSGLSGVPTVTGVTDTQGNTWAAEHSYTTSTPYLAVWAAVTNGSGGPTNPLVASTDTVTVTWSAATSSGWGILGAASPGVSTIDVNQIANGTSTTATVSGTPVQAGETALGCFVWASGGGAGTVLDGFTQVGQEDDGVYVTISYLLSPASGVSLSTGYTIGSAAFRAVLLTLEASPVGPVADPPYVYTRQSVMRAAIW